MRWIYSTSAKDIGTMYLAFAVFSGYLKLELKNFAICLKSHLIFFKNQRADNFTYVFNHKYSYLRDFMQKLFYISMFTLLFIHSFDLYSFFITSNLGLFHFYLHLLIIFIHLWFKMSQEFILLRSEKKRMSTYYWRNDKSELSSYLAGLIESDGFINIPKRAQSTPTIKIVFHSKDKPLAQCLKDTLGCGSIQPASKNSIDFVVRDKKELFN